MFSRPLRAVLFALLCVSPAVQAQVTLRIDAPTLTFNKMQFRYEPYPMQVTVVVKNNGNTPTQLASARIEIISPLAFDASEASVTIKQLLPSVVAAHDSAKASWLLVQPPVLTNTLQRVVFWVKFGATDSSMVGRNIPIPAADPAILSTSLSGVADLHVRADSLGYDGNPFTVYAGLINSGETRADSVRLQLVLPADFVLDPPSQQNPVLFAQYEPAPITDLHFTTPFTVRYTGCTRTPRSDSIVALVTARNIAGAPLTARASKTFAIDGLAQRYSLLVNAPDALQYDTATTYAPNPASVTVVVKNISEQTERLQTLALSIAGEGASPRQGLVRAIGTLAPQETKSFTWEVDVTRAAAPRDLVFTATVTDADLETREATKTVAVPGKPFGFEIAELVAPDSIPVNAERTAYRMSLFDVAFRVRNAFWKNVRVARTRITPIGTGVSPGGPIEDTPGHFLKPDEVSNSYSGSFRIIGGYAAHTVTFEVLAITSEGDTAIARHDVYFPALVPRVSIMRSGIDSLAVDAGSMTYVPNPFEQRFFARNEGSANVMLDSITVDAVGDGIARNGARSFIFSQSLAPQQETQTRSWTFTAERRARSRFVRIAYTAHFNKNERITDTAAIFIPGIEPELAFELLPLPAVAYDSIEIYHPSQITVTAIARNTGPVPFRLDSVRFSPPAPWGPAPVSAYRVDAMLQPGDTIRLAWPVEFMPSMRSDSLRCRFIATAQYDSSRSGTASQELVIPGKSTALGIEMLPRIPDLTLRGDGADYNEKPLVTRFRVYNDSWVRQTVEQTDFTIKGPGLIALTPLKRSPSYALSPYGYSQAIIDSFDVAPSAIERTIDYTIAATFARGLTGSYTGSFRIPGITPTSVDPVLPSETALLAPYPNPSAGGVIAIPFSIGRAGHARIDAYNALGERVATIVDAEFREGLHLLSWPVPSVTGVYLLRLTTGGFAAARVVVLR